MTSARTLITNRRRREASTADSFLTRLARLDRNRAALVPRSVLFKNRPSRQAA